MKNIAQCHLFDSGKDDNTNIPTRDMQGSKSLKSVNGLERVPVQGQNKVLLQGIIAV